MPHITDEEQGREHLTDELRAHFENVGDSLVEFDVVHHRYSSPFKHQAALYWLRERRRARDEREASRFKIVAWLAGLTLAAAVVGIVVTVRLSG